ncbi:MAG: diguanylate cyclase [Frankiales bacterium]|nr:diguanylate cyclase [Frankiales bacterium]
MAADKHKVVGLRSVPSRPTSAWRLLGVYAAASLVPVVLLGLVLFAGYRTEANNHGLARARTEASLLATTAVAPQLGGVSLDKGLPEADVAEMTAISHRIIDEGRLLRFRLRNTRGEVVFSEDGSGFGGEIEDEVLDAARGEVVSLLTRVNSDVGDNGPKGVRAVEVYMPMYAANKQILGVLEVYVPYEPIAADISAGLNRLALQLSIGLGVLYVVLTLVSFSLTRRLRREGRHNHFLARHDPLTSLPNRVLFRQSAEEAVAAAVKDNRRCAVAVIDLDRFKEVNDTLGHVNGDALLVELALRVKEHAADRFFVARLGGDEFGVIIPDIDDAAAGDELWELRRVLEQDVQVSGLPLSVQASIGFAIAQEDGDDADELIQYADVAMYHAKKNHLGVARYDRSQDRYDAAKLALVTELRQAIEQDQLVLHFQPKIATDSGGVIAVEALVRWQHPVAGLMPPDAFLPVAEQTDLIDPLTTWVLNAALHQLRTWGDDAAGLAMAVNISARSLIRNDFADEVLTALREADVAPERLLLEITETALVADPQRAARILARLYREGVRVSIDDFGKGQTSLGYLSQLALYELKIDKSFVLDREDPTNAAIISSVIQLGHNLGLQVVAEGVETTETFAWLCAAGCDVAQGFLFARPMPAAAMSEWLRDRAALIPSQPAPLVN